MVTVTELRPLAKGLDLTVQVSWITGILFWGAYIMGCATLDYMAQSKWRRTLHKANTFLLL